MNLHNQISDIMDRFDFEKVLGVMHFLNWRWLGEPVTLERLKSQANELLWQAANGYNQLGKLKEHGYSVATGGFIARVEHFANGDARLNLTFYIDEVSGRDD